MAMMSTPVFLLTCGIVVAAAVAGAALHAIYRYFVGHPFRILSVEQIDYLESEVSRVSGLMAARGIPHIILGGTELGVARYGFQLPWDDDADFAIMKEDEGCLLEFFAEALDRAPTIKPFGYQVRLPNRVQIDFFVYEWDKRCGVARTTGFPDFITCSEWEGREAKTFGIRSGGREKTAYFAGDAEARMIRNFGSDWKTKAVASRMHC